LTIGELDTLKVTVYISENQYGQIALGEQASLSVDSFSNETFTATVTRIADQRNTPAERANQGRPPNTVYAVELSIQNTDGKLKPACPSM
jgi:multidrug resistance efflux pump